MARTKAATRRRIEKFVADLPIEFLECRQFGHAWTASTVTKTGGRFEVTIRCLRCASYAVERLRSDGVRNGKRNIQYVEGYLSHGLGRLDGAARAALRLELADRLGEVTLNGDEKIS